MSQTFLAVYLAEKPPQQKKELEIIKGAMINALLNNQKVSDLIDSDPELMKLREIYLEACNLQHELSNPK